MREMTALVALQLARRDGGDASVRARRRASDELTTSAIALSLQREAVANTVAAAAPYKGWLSRDQSQMGLDPKLGTKAARPMLPVQQPPSSGTGEAKRLDSIQRITAKVRATLPSSPPWLRSRATSSSCLC